MDVIKLEGIYVEGYGTIAKAVMQDRNLHVTAKAIYSYMSSFAGGSQSCFPKIVFKNLHQNLSIKKSTLPDEISYLAHTTTRSPFVTKH